MLNVHYGDGKKVEADLMLVAVGRAPLVEGLGLEELGVQVDRRAGIGTDEHRRTASRTSTRSATAPATGSSPTPPSARARWRQRTRSVTTRLSTPARRAAPDLHRPGSGRRRSDRGARRASSTATRVAVGTFPWVANARAVMQDATVGWVKSIHETRYGELLGLVMVGPHVTDLIEAGVVALDAEATVETVADGIAAHPTLSEAIKEAGLVALGRPIHMPPKRKVPANA